MPIPKEDAQFIENNIWGSSIYGSSYIIQPDIPTWINTTTSFAEGVARQLDLVDYENNLFLTEQLRGRVYKEVFRISGEVIRENFKNILIQNWFWTSHENLIELLKLYKTTPDNTITQDLLLQTVQDIPFRGEQ